MAALDLPSLTATTSWAEQRLSQARVRPSSHPACFASPFPSPVFLRVVPSRLAIAASSLCHYLTLLPSSTLDLTQNFHYSI